MDTWVFAYGSLVWNRDGITVIEEKIGELDGWHRDWTWISTRRHGAPTCSLQKGGKVKGVYLKLYPEKVEESIENLEKREGHKKEFKKDLPGFPGITYFWPMGNNLREKLGINNLEGRELYRFLACVANRIAEKGPDGYTAKEYALKVHEFDPQDPITNMYVEELSIKTEKSSGETAENKSRFKANMR